MMGRQIEPGTTLEQLQQDRLREVLEMQLALQRVRRAQAQGEPVSRADLDLLEPDASYKGGNLDRLWASEEY